VEIDFSDIVTYHGGEATEMTVSYAGFPGGDGVFPPIVLKKVPHVQIKALDAGRDATQCPSPGPPVWVHWQVEEAKHLELTNGGNISDVTGKPGMCFAVDAQHMTFTLKATGDGPVANVTSGPSTSATSRSSSRGRRCHHRPSACARR
jgi:hypothetical protein